MIPTLECFDHVKANIQYVIVIRKCHPCAKHQNTICSLKVCNVFVAVRSVLSADQINGVMSASPLIATQSIFS